MHSTVSATTSMLFNENLSFGGHSIFSIHRRHPPRSSRVAMRLPSVTVISGPCELAGYSRDSMYTLDGFVSHVEYHLAVGGHSIFSIHRRHPPRSSRVARRSPSVTVISGPCKLAEEQLRQHVHTRRLRQPRQVPSRCWWLLIF